MKILLHVGTHKTGTTSIQESCSLNRGRLQARGIHYPNLRDFGGRFSERHHELAATFASAPRKALSITRFRKLVDALASSCAEDDIVLLSAESIYRHVYDPDGNLDFWGGHRAYLDRLAAAFEGHEVEAVILFREHAAFAESLFQEVVKAVSYSGSFAAYLDAYQPYFDYRKHVEALEEVFASVHVLSFAEMAGNDLTEKFLASLGRDPGSLEPVPRKNISLPPHLVLFLRDQNKFLSSNAQKRLKRHLLKHAGEFGDGFESFGFFTLELRERFLARCQDDIAWIEDRYGGRQGAGFFPSSAPKPAGRDQLTANEVNRIAASFTEAQFGDRKGSAVRRRLLRLIRRG